MAHNELEAWFESKMKAMESGQPEETEAGSLESRLLRDLTGGAGETGDHYGLDIRDFLDVINSCAGVLESSEASYSNRLRANRLVERSLDHIEKIIDVFESRSGDEAE